MSVGMRRRPSDSNSSSRSHALETIRQRLLNVARVVVLLVVVAAPWAFGGVEFQAQSILYLGLLVALVCWAIGVLLGMRRPSWRGLSFPTLVVPLCLGLLLGAAQLAPLGNAPVELVAPLRLAAPESSTAAVSDALRESFARSAISICPTETRLRLAQLSMATLAVSLGAFLFRERRHQLWLWMTLLANGVALSVFGIVQRLTWNERLFWTVPLTQGGQPFASFVNRNNAAGFLNLCLAGGLGALVWIMAGRQQDDGSSKEESPDNHSPRAPLPLLAIALIATIAAGVLASLSRGGVLSMLVAGAVTVAVWARRGRTVAPISIALAAILIAAAFLRSSELETLVQSRLSSVLSHEVVRDGRLANWRDALHSARNLWPTGTGLGTYRFAYLPHQMRFDPRAYYHAENQYLEALVEGGVFGLLLMLAAVLLIVQAIRALLRYGGGSMPEGAACVGLFALTSQAVHGGFDFGLSIPANMLVFALLCGAIAGRAARVCGHLQSAHFFRLPPLRAGLLVFAAVSLLIVHSIGGYSEILSAAPGQTALASVRKLGPMDQKTTVPQVEAAIHQLHQAERHRSADPDLHARLAEFWILRYRLQLREQLAREGLLTGMSLSDEQVWELTHPIALHRRCCELTRSGQNQQLEALLSERLVQENLVPAAKSLLAARDACLLWPGIDVDLASLSFLIDGSGTGTEPTLMRATLIAPSDPNLLFSAGMLAQNAGLDALARHCWQQCLSLAPPQHAAALRSAQALASE